MPIHCAETLSYFPAASMFPLQNSAEESMKSDRGEEEDDFQTDNDEEKMEVDKQVVQKRKKVREYISEEKKTICAHVSVVFIHVAIFLSSRYKVVVFRRNSGIITGNQDVRNTEK